MLLLLILAPLLGAILGSATNAFVPRLASGEGGYLTDRSRCPHCKTILRPQHLVPVLSYLVLRGKCASCRATIPLQYLVVELISAATFLLLTFAELQQPTPSFARLGMLLLLATVLLALSSYDALTSELPVALLVPAILVAFGVALLPGAPTLLDAGIGALVAAGFFGLQILIATPLYRARAKRAGLAAPTDVVGMGDAVLALVPGIAVGWPGVIVALAAAYILGALVTLPLLALKIVSRDRTIPFGPFLAAGTIVGILYGSTLIDWYRALLGF